MTKSRSAAGVGVLNGEIFAVGGHDGLQIFNSVSNSLPTRKSHLPAYNCQNLRRVLPSCYFHEISRGEEVGLKEFNYTLKITIFVNM